LFYSLGKRCTEGSEGEAQRSWFDVVDSGDDFFVISSNSASWILEKSFFGRDEDFVSPFIGEPERSFLEKLLIIFQAR
jgi:hypothetical protein